MDSEEKTVRLLRLKAALEHSAFTPGEIAPHVTHKGEKKEVGWLFDIRNILLTPQVIEDYTALFWDTFGNEPTQIGSIETAGIALVSSLVSQARQWGAQCLGGFYIRKSRKKDGLTKMIEGVIQSRGRIVLVDDLTNTGSSLIRQVEVLQSLGMRVHAVWVLVRFRDIDFYEYFRERNIEIHSLFELNDFSASLGLKNRKDTVPPARQSFEVLWKFSAPDPSYHHVVSKSNPILDEKRIFFGSDAGVFWALDQETGAVIWSRKVGFHPKGKGIFSTPALYDGIIYFGAYDGNFYALDAATGKTKWMYMEADWIGSSPAIAPDLGLIFVGLEFGLWRKRGGIVALDVRTGEKVWSHSDMPNFTHSSPLYIAEHQQVVIGSNDGAARLYDAKNGRLIWKFETGVLSEQALLTGFSAYDIKESFAYDRDRDLILFGNIAGTLSIVARKNGEKRAEINAQFGFYSTPLIYKAMAYASSVDKYLYCIDLDTLSEKWKYFMGARVFASPTSIAGSIYIGSNNGRLIELDPKTGTLKSSFTVTERITNSPVYNPQTGNFFLPTFANEIYCLKKKV